MDAVVARAYRRRGYRVLVRIVLASLTPRRRVITAGVAALTAASGAALLFAVEWDPGRTVLDATRAAFTILAVALIATWICLTVWLRRDRGSQEPLTFLETGELGRVTREDGTLDIPEERRATVLRATEFQRPRIASAALLGFAPAVIGLAIAPITVILIVSGDGGWFAPLYVVLLVLSNAYFTRTTVQSLGHLDVAHELAGGDTPGPADELTTGSVSM